MVKTGFRTYDIFTNKSHSDNFEVAMKCFEQATKCGLYCKLYKNDRMEYKLEMQGFKSQFIKYYMTTLCEGQKAINGFKRLCTIIINWR